MRAWPKRCSAIAIPAWPHDGIALVREASAPEDRTDVHVLRDWCWLGTARSEGELAQLLEAPPRPRFDIDVARLLLARWAKGSLQLLPVPHSQADAITTP